MKLTQNIFNLMYNSNVGTYQKQNCLRHYRGVQELFYSVNQSNCREPGRLDDDQPHP